MENLSTIRFSEIEIKTNTAFLGMELSGNMTVEEIVCVVKNLAMLRIIA